MTTDTAPTGTTLARPARARPITRRDRLRLAEYDRRRSAGESDTDAWRAICRSDIGFSSIRPDDSDSRVRRHLAWFTGAVAPERIEAGRRALAETIPDAVSALGDIIRGDFGEGKVRVRQDGTEDVTIDAAAAGVRSQNARWLLERTGVVAPASASGVVVNGPAQFNFASAAKARAANG